jgi:hypothetical protein
MAFDFGKNNVAQVTEAGYEFELIYPITGEGTDAFITVRGEASKTVQAYNRAQFNREQQKAKSGRNADKVVPIEEFYEKAIERAVVKTIGWRGIVVDGEELVFTESNAKKFYAENDWIREAVERESAEITNFRS